MKWTPGWYSYLCGQLRKHWGPQDLSSWAPYAVHPPYISYKDTLALFEDIRQAGCIEGPWANNPPTSARAIENQLAWLTTVQAKEKIEKIKNGASIMNSMAHAAFEAGLITAPNCIAVIERAAGALAEVTKEDSVDRALTTEDGIDIAAISSLEGKRSVRKSYEAERSPRLRKALIKLRIKQGKLRCEVCEVQFIGQMEGHEVVHHTLPVACGERETTLDDLALLCPNHHRTVHHGPGRGLEPLSIAQARKEYRETSSATRVARALKNFWKMNPNENPPDELVLRLFVNASNGAL